MCLAVPSEGARLHVLPGGERSLGSSVAGDWSPANCYPTVQAAAAMASPVDSLLLSRDHHPVATTITLPRLLANRDLDDASESTRLVLEAGGGFVVDGAATSTVLRGVQFVAAEPASALPAVRVLAPVQAGSEVRVEACVFERLRGTVSSAAGGAALHVTGGFDRIAVIVLDSSFIECESGGAGGAIFAANGVDLTLQSSVFEGSEARFTGSTVFGGAIAVFADTAGASLVLDSCVILDSTSWGPGGAVYVQDAPLVMRDTEVRGSRSAVGGVTNWGAGAGVFLRRAGSDPTPIELIAERCSFVDNRADLTLGTGGADGGGLMIRGSDALSPVDATIIECRFERNFSDQGAGLYVGRSVNATIERCLFLENTAQTNGGGAYKGGELAANIGETALFSYCVFARNRAGWDQNGHPIDTGGFGGAFMVRRNPRAEFHHCTFADNLSGPNGKRGDAIFLWNEGWALTDDRQRSRIVNCLFYGEFGNAEQVRAEFQAISEIVHSAWESGQVFAHATAMSGTVVLGEPPFVGPDDWRLRPTSECVDAGSAVVEYDIDFVGTPVPLGAAVDIGAIEHIAPVAAPQSDGMLRLRAVHPNPANPRTLVEFELARAGHAHLAVFDASGRRVTDLLDAELNAGVHRVVWSGRDARGRDVASGTYFLRLVSSGASATGKLVLVR
jgi:hypothetical protein